MAEPGAQIIPAGVQGQDRGKRQPDVADQAAGAEELTRVSDALDELDATEPRLARIVDFKFFCGFSFAEIGSMLGVSERTVQRDWEKARIYLHRVLRDDTAPPDRPALP